MASDPLDDAPGPRTFPGDVSATAIPADVLAGALEVYSEVSAAYGPAVGFTAAIQAAYYVGRRHAGRSK